MTTVTFDDVKANIDQPQRLVLDARAPDRFRGENETMDPIGGHIPGARNRLFKDNLGADGHFKPAAQLRQEFDAITGGRAATQLINQCGSGVTACHNLLAMEVAGLQGAALYPGSWSEWSAQPGAPHCHRRGLTTTHPQHNNTAGDTHERTFLDKALRPHWLRPPACWA